MKLTWLRRLTIATSNEKIINVVEASCPSIKHIFKFRSDYIKQQLRQEQNLFWKDVINSYLILTLKASPKNDLQCYSTHIWYNPDIKVGGSSVCYKRWVAAGVVILGKNIHYLPIKTFNIPQPLPIALIKEHNKGCKLIYRQIHNSQESPRSLQKWKHDLTYLQD